jgi:hypothetical protein
MSIIEEGHAKSVCMAHLAMVGSHVTNGVAALHTDLLKTSVFPDFVALFPGRFQNKTNGVTPRRWLNQCNPGLTQLISHWIEQPRWLRHFGHISLLRPVADHPGLQAEWQAVKQKNKARLAGVIKAACKVTVRTDALFDVQVCLSLWQGSAGPGRHTSHLRLPPNEGQAHPRVQAPAVKCAVLHPPLQHDQGDVTCGALPCCAAGHHFR